MLKVRNFTNAPLHLKAIERLQTGLQEADNGNGIANFTRNLTSLVTHLNATKIASTRHGSFEDPKLVSHQDLDIRIEAFATNKTNIDASQSLTEIVRLTVETQGQLCHIQVVVPALIPPSQNRSDDTSVKRLTGIYIPSDSFLAVFSSTNPQAWMSYLDDRTPLAALSIPGTHNSTTCFKALPSVRCQVVSVRTQLDNGVRFLDIRVQPETPDDPRRDGLILVHGVFPISLTGNKYFRPLIDEIRSFLDANPMETVIISVKREGPGSHTDQQLSRILSEHYARPDDPRWWTAPRLPTLGEARGRIVLLRRFALDERLTGEGYGLDAQHWTHSTPHERRGSICVQDFCDVLEPAQIEAKIRYVCDQLDRAGCRRENHAGAPRSAAAPLYLNYLSASNFWNVACWPDRIAARLNPAALKHLCTTWAGGDGGTGIVICDWVGHGGDWDLVRSIIGQNARLISKPPV